jgi:FixJ family two-component response regulator
MKNSQLTAPTVYVVDDDVAVRESLSSLIRAEGMEVEVFGSPLDFLNSENLRAFACVVLDVRMPGLDGLSLQEELSKRGCELPVIFITGHGDVPDAVRAMKAGAIDFLKKPFEDYDLLRAITHALSRVSRSFHAKLELAELLARYEQLTPRECEILALVTQGKPNKVIAIELGVSESTVKVHRHNVMGKMQMRSLPELTLALQRLKKLGE